MSSIIYTEHRYRTIQANTVLCSVIFFDSAPKQEAKAKPGKDVLAMLQERWDKLPAKQEKVSSSN